MRYQFLIDTYETEIQKVLSAWTMFEDEDLPKRPHPSDTRGRSVLEHMVHQSMSEDLWFKTMLGIDVTENPLPRLFREQPRRAVCLPLPVGHGRGSRKVLRYDVSARRGRRGGAGAPWVEYARGRAFRVGLSDSIIF